jgi:hypothetical protein
VLLFKSELDVFRLPIEPNNLQIQIAVATELNKQWLYKYYTQNVGAEQKASYWLPILQNERVMSGDVRIFHSGFV